MVLVKRLNVILLITVSSSFAFANEAFLQRRSTTKTFSYLFEHSAVEVIDRQFQNAERLLGQTHIPGHSQRIPSFNVEQFRTESRSLSRIYEDLGSVVMHGKARLTDPSIQQRNIYGLVQRSRFHYERLMYVANSRLSEINEIFKKMEKSGQTVMTINGKKFNLDDLVKEAGDIVDLQNKMIERQERLMKIAGIDSEWSMFKKDVVAKAGPHRFYLENGKYVASQWRPTVNAYTNQVHPSFNSRHHNNILERARGAFGRKSAEFYKNILKSVKKVRP